eukprot:gene3473-3953_t
MAGCDSNHTINTVCNNHFPECFNDTIAVYVPPCRSACLQLVEECQTSDIYDCTANNPNHEMFPVTSYTFNSQTFECNDISKIDSSNSVSFNRCPEFYIYRRPANGGERQHDEDIGYGYVNPNSHCVMECPSPIVGNTETAEKKWVRFLRYNLKTFSLLLIMFLVTLVIFVYSIWVQRHKKQIGNNMLNLEMTYVVATRIAGLAILPLYGFTAQARKIWSEKPVDRQHDVDIGYSYPNPSSHCVMECPSPVFSESQWQVLFKTSAILGTMSFICMLYLCITYGGTKTMCPEPGRSSRSIDKLAVLLGVFNQLGAALTGLCFTTMTLNLLLTIKSIKPTKLQERIYLAVIITVAVFMTLVPGVKKAYGYPQGFISAWIFDPSIKMYAYFIPAVCIIVIGVIYIIVIAHDIFVGKGRETPEGDSCNIEMPDTPKINDDLSDVGKPANGGDRQHDIDIGYSYPNPNSHCVMECPSPVFSDGQWRILFRTSAIIGTMSFICMLYLCITYGILIRKTDRNSLCLLLWCFAWLITFVDDVVYVNQGTKTLCPEPGRSSRSVDKLSVTLAVLNQLELSSQDSASQQ